MGHFIQLQRILLVTMMAAFGLPSALAWDCMNTHRTMVTVTANASGHSDETRIDLAASDFPADYNFTSDGRDVRVVLASDDLTPVDHIVTGWDGFTRTGTIYVKLPALGPLSSTSVYIYYGDSALTSLGDVDAVFPSSGLRLRSRVSSADPADTASARAAFASATTDVSDQVYSSITGLNNRALGGTNGNFGWCISAMIEVTPATAGVWGFRYGADFGHGGHLYMRETELEQQWNDDLWWAGNYVDTTQTLEGTIALDAGWHRYEALGFEGCCDGPVGWQARAPGGAWQDMSSSNFSMRATQCVSTTVTLSTAAPQSCSAEPDIEKAVTVLSDPVGSLSPFALPGSIVEYAIDVTNDGRRLDDGTVSITDNLPEDIKLIVAGPSAFELVDG